MSKKTENQLKRDTVWHELHDLMEDCSCPICELVSKRRNSFMSSILYEAVNDPDIRKKINNADGLCNTHAYQLLEKGDVLGHAIIYEDIIDNIIEELNRVSGKKSLNHDKCLFCEAESQSESTYINHFVTCLSDELFRNRYREHGMLCLKHFLDLSKIIKDNQSGIFLKNETIKKYMKITEQLKSIKRKNDYRFSNEHWSKEEKKAWKKAVAIINGYPGMKE